MSATTTLRMILLGEDKSAGKALSGVGSEADKASTKMDKFHKVGAAAGVALAGGLALAGKAAVDMTKKAAEDQQSASRLAQTLQKATGATKEQRAAVEDWISAQGVAYGVADDDLRPALSKLAVATGSVTKAQKLASLAMDISAGTGKDLQAVSFALAKAQSGNVSGLSRLGVQTTKTTKDTAAYEKAQTAAKSAALAYTSAIKAHGKHSIEASIALDKLKQANEGVKTASEATKKTTLSLDQITKNLSQTYGGAAAKNAETAAGKQKILTVQMSELQEKIGYALIPVMDKLVTIGLKVVNWISNNTRTAGILVGAIGSLLAILVAASAATKVYNTLAGIFAIRTAAQTEGTLAYAVAQKASAVASKVAAAGQWLLNAAMDANPIGLVVIAIAALVAGIIVAYKHSETFRKIVQGAFHAVQAAAAFAFNWVKGHWRLLLAILTGPIGAAVIVIATHWSKIRAGASALWSAIRSGAAKVKAFILLPFQLARAAVSAVWSNMRDDAGKFVGFVAQIPGKIRGLIGGFVSAGRSLIEALFRGILAAARSAGGFVSSLVGSIKSAINSSLHLPLQVNFDKGPLHIHATVIPALAAGGIVSRPTTALIGEAGPEAVVPLSGPNSPFRNGLGGDTYQITINGALDPVAVGTQVEQALSKVKRLRGGRALAFQ